MFTLEMKTQRNGGGSGRDSGGDDSDSDHSGGSTSTGSGGSPGIRHEEKYPVVRFTDLHTDSTAKDIRELFRGVGRIKWHSMIYDYKGKFMGEAEVEYERNSNAHKAVRELHNKDFKGKPLNATIIEVFGSEKGFSRGNFNPTARYLADSESEPETSKDKGKKRT